MLHRIREAWMPKAGDGTPFDGPVEVDETYMGGKRKNMSNAKRNEMAGTGRGAVGKTAVVGAKDRASNQVSARVVTSTDKPTLQGFVVEHTAPGATVYSGRGSGLRGDTLRRMRRSSTQSPSTSAGMAHTNGMESFWSMLKRAHTGTFHKMSTEVSESIRAGVRRQAQRARVRHPRPDARARHPSHGA